MMTLEADPAWKRMDIQKQINEMLIDIDQRMTQTADDRIAQSQRAGNLILRTIGMARAKVKIGLRNLGFNLERFCTLMVVSA